MPDTRIAILWAMDTGPYASIITQLFPDATLIAQDHLTGGVSAEVSRLDLEHADGRSFSVVLRIHGASHAGHTAELEFDLLQSLGRVGLPVPEPIHRSTAAGDAQAPYLVMEYIDGSSNIPAAAQVEYTTRMAATLHRIHQVPVIDLPSLPARCDPLPEVFDYLPPGDEWTTLRHHLGSLQNPSYADAPKLLHGDFWPENLLWQGGEIVGVLDWEDAALGDPLSDVACTGLELRYKFGESGEQTFFEAYRQHQAIDDIRLNLWQVYVAAAAQKYMGQWRLSPALEAHMRAVALTTLREAGERLLSAA